MAGASVTLDINDRELLALFNGLLDRGQDLGPIWQEFGDHMREVEESRFDLAVGPDGEPWEALSPAYQRRKKKHQDDILVLDGFLRDTIIHQVSADGRGFSMGSNRLYAATHQFGDEERDIPARPFLGFNDDDLAELAQIAAQYLLPGAGTG